MISTFYPPYSFGGDAVMIQALSRGLAARGHKVDVIHCIDSYRALAKGEPAAAEPEPEGVTVHGLRSPFGILSPLLTHQTGQPMLKWSAIQNILSREQFDVVHFHNTSLVGGPGLLKRPLPGSPLKLYTLHEHWLLCPMHTLFRDNRELCTEKHCVSCGLHYRRPPQWWRYGNLLHESVAAIDAFLAPTRFTRDIHLQSGLPMKIRVLPNFQETRPGTRVPEADPYFLFAGRLEKLKGVHELIQAFRNSNHRLLLAGEGSEHGALLEQARECSNITFLGKAGRERIAALLEGATAVVVPSVTYEVFPLVMLEAFAQGTPVIARELGSLAEIVKESGGGLLFQDSTGLADAVQRLASDRQLRDRLGESGRNAWREKWTLDSHLERYLAIVEEMKT